MTRSGGRVQMRLREPSKEVREPRTGAVHASQDATWIARRNRSLIIATAAALFMAGIGAAQTALLSAPLRLAYWLILMLAGTALGLLAQTAARRWRIFPEQIVLQAGVVILLMWLPQSIIVLVVQRYVAGEPLTQQIILNVIALVFVVSAAVTAVNYLADRPPLQTKAAVNGEAPARFLNRLPPRLRGAEIWAVEADDHYLRLHTSAGHDLILMRLGDAVAELKGIEGARTHRSWWVARNGYIGCERGRGGARLLLRNGLAAPVSRTYISALRGAGWL